MRFRSRILGACTVSFLLAFACWVASSKVGRALWVVPGLILLGWRLAVAANWRGAADAMPKTRGVGPFQTTTTTAMLRLIFGVFALWGAAALVVGAVALVG
jgi:hypothetical protein